MSLSKVHRHVFVGVIRWVAWLSLSVCGAAKTDSIAGPCAHRDSVVLLHGLGRTAVSMKRLEWALQKEGYYVINLSYPSTRLSVESAASWLDGKLRNHTFDPATRIHFVAHSLGGVVVRQYLSHQPLPNLGRVVTLASPNQGSELAERLKTNLLFKMFTGPAGQQLGTTASSKRPRLGPPVYELGVIAGDRSLNPLSSAWLPAPDDGKVSVRSTHVDGMRDFLVVHHTHTWMMWRQDVIDAVIRFLGTGRFS